MTLLARAIARLVGVLLLFALAVAGLATAVFAIGSGSGTFSLPGGLELIKAPDALTQVGDLLGALAAKGPTAQQTLLGAAIAIAAAVVLLIGALLPRRERLVDLADDGDGGDLQVRRHALSDMAENLAEGDRNIAWVRARAKSRRFRRGARLRLRVRPGLRKIEPEQLRSTTLEQLKPLTDPFPIGARVKTKDRSR